MKKFVLVTITLVLLLSACTAAPSPAPISNFIFKYGVGAKNEIDTFAGTFTKDMIADPPITTKLTLTQEEMTQIWQKMEEIDFLDYPDNFSVIVPSGGITMFVTSSFSYYFKVQYSNGVKELRWDDAIQNPDVQASKLRELTQLIQKIIESKDEYKRLPTPRGGYV